ncbi:MAG: fibronectin type III domain-containing protein [Thermoplasmatota archaeon]
MGVRMRAKVVLNIILLLLLGSMAMEPLLVPAPENRVDASMLDPGEPTRFPMSSPWPMFKQNMGGTGLSPYNTSKNPGRLKWEFRTTGMLSSPVIDRNNNIYFTSDDGYLFSLYPNGTLRWKTILNTTGFTESPALTSDSRVIIHSLDGGLYSYDLTGDLDWYADTGYLGINPPILTYNGTILVASVNRSLNSNEPVLLGFHMNGKLDWIWEGEDTTGVQYFCVQPDGTIVIPASKEPVYLVNRDGTNRSSIIAFSNVETSVISDEDGYVYFGTTSMGVVKVDPDGLPVVYHWGDATPRGSFISPSLGPDGTLIVNSFGGSMDATSSGGGDKWLYEFAPPTSPTRGSNPSVGSDGSIFFGREDVGAIALHPNGTLRWKLASLNVSSHVPVIGQDGTVYYPGNNGSMYAVGMIPPKSPVLSATNAGGKVALSWSVPSFDGGSDIIVYSIYRGFSPGMLGLYDEFGAGTTTYTDPMVTLGREYYYAVTATSRIGESPYSNIVKVIPARAPDPPILTDAYPEGDTIVVKWDPPENTNGAPLEEYHIYREEQGVAGSVMETVPANTTMFVDRTAQFHTSYTYSVTAVNSAGESRPSDRATARLITAPTAPLNPEAVFMKEDGHVLVTWDPPESDGGMEPLNYELERTTNGFNLATISGGSTSPDYYDTSVEMDNLYSYRVRASNGLYTSNPTSWFDVITLDVPNSPRNLTASHGDGNITLAWRSPVERRYNELLGYRLKVFSITGSRWELSREKEVMPGHLTHTESDLINGIVYGFNLTAFNSAGESLEVSVFSTPSGYPDPPDKIAVTTNGRDALLSWEQPKNDGGSPITSYLVYRRIGPGGFQFLARTPSNVTSMKDPGLEKEVTYGYHVLSENTRGVSEPSREVSITLDRSYFIPPAPKDMYVEVNNVSIVVRWSHPANNELFGIEKYAVYRLQEGTLQPVVYVLPSHFLFFNDTNVEQGVNYTYWMTSRNSAGESRPTYNITTHIPVWKHPVKPPPAEEGESGSNTGWIFLGAAMGALLIITALVVVYLMQKGEGFSPPPDNEILTSSMDGDKVKGREGAP